MEQAGTMVPVCNPGTGEAEAGELPEVEVMERLSDQWIQDSPLHIQVYCRTRECVQFPGLQSKACQAAGDNRY